jgi:hypothetical protein
MSETEEVHVWMAGRGEETLVRYLRSLVEPSALLSLVYPVQSVMCKSELGIAGSLERVAVVYESLRAAEWRSTYE